MPQIGPYDQLPPPDNTTFEIITTAFEQKARGSVTSTELNPEQLDSESLTFMGTVLSDSISETLESLTRIQTDPLVKAEGSTYTAGYEVERQFPIFAIDDEDE
jgi:hypothetical protein